jgi:hypothetical protein
MTSRAQPAESIAKWRPIRHGLDPDTAQRLAADARDLVGKADTKWKSPTAAKLACGHVFRYLAWTDSQTSPGDHPTMVGEYLDHLTAAGTRPGTLKPIAAALRACVASPQAPAVAPPRSAADAIAGYTPDPQRVAPELWADIAEQARAAVAATEPADARQAASRLAPTSLYLAWVNVADRQREPFTPDSVERFLAAGRTTWTPGTHTTYTSQLRRIARTAQPKLWPTTHRKRTAAELCDIDELTTICRSIRGQDPTARRQLSAIVLLARGAGITGVAAALVQPSDVGRDGDRITVAVRSGRAPRVVPVIDEWAEALVDLAHRSAAAGDHYLLGGRGNPSAAANRPGGLTARHAQLTGVNIDSQRLRNTWLSWLLDQPLGLRTTLGYAGLRSTTPLDDLLRAGTVNDTPAQLTRIARLL